MLGGLTSATALTLVVIPVAYDVLDGAGERIRAWLRRPASAEAQREPHVPAAGLAAGD